METFPLYPILKTKDGKQGISRHAYYGIYVRKHLSLKRILNENR